MTVQPEIWSPLTCLSNSAKDFHPCTFMIGLEFVATSSSFEEDRNSESRLSYVNFISSRKTVQRPFKSFTFLNPPPLPTNRLFRCSTVVYFQDVVISSVSRAFHTSYFFEMKYITLLHRILPSPFPSGSTTGSFLVPSSALCIIIQVLMTPQNESHYSCIPSHFLSTVHILGLVKVSVQTTSLTRLYLLLISLSFTQSFSLSSPCIIVLRYCFYTVIF